MKKVLLVACVSAFSTVAFSQSVATTQKAAKQKTVKSVTKTQDVAMPAATTDAAIQVKAADLPVYAPDAVKLPSTNASASKNVTPVNTSSKKPASHARPASKVTNSEKN